ncbi:MAG: hypothetical protein HGA31_05510 [Candidatus Moranbacteria bacterium]|nr:hypothetical protein [Candidatus Moranbacteria bacterium]
MLTKIVASMGPSVFERAFRNRFSKEFHDGSMTYAIDSPQFSDIPVIIAPCGPVEADWVRSDDDIQNSFLASDAEMRRIQRFHEAVDESDHARIYLGFNLLIRYVGYGDFGYPKSGPQLVSRMAALLGRQCRFVLSMSVGSPYIKTYPNTMFVSGDIRVDPLSPGYPPERPVWHDEDAIETFLSRFTKKDTEASLEKYITTYLTELARKTPVGPANVFN